jgi:nucleotide-binding universal stress UspA family protein
MILITCTIATFATQKGGKNISLNESAIIESIESDRRERILIPISNPDTIEELISLGTIIKSKDSQGLYALNVIDTDAIEAHTETRARRILGRAEMAASATDIQLHKLLRYDSNISNGITGVIKEQNITDLILGLHVKKAISESFLGKLSEGILSKCNTTTFIYKAVQPISTIKRHIVIIPPNAEKVIGFPFWLAKIWSIPKNTGSKLVLYVNEATSKLIKNLQTKHPIEAEFRHFEDWEDCFLIQDDIEKDDNLIFVLSRANKPSYQEGMAKIPEFLNKYFQSTSFILIYPIQIGVRDHEAIDLNNPSLVEPIEKLDELGKSIFKLFRRK